MVLAHHRRYVTHGLLRIITILATLSVPGVFLGQAPLAAKDQNSPSFIDTVQFLNRSVSAEQSSVSSANRCEIAIVRNRLYDLAIPSDTYLKSTDRYGVQHYGFTILVASEKYRVVQFRLENIDPGSIYSKSLASPKFVHEHDVDEHPDELATP